MKKQLPILLMLACAVVFAFGVVKLFQLRFEAGDIYPEYSSLRADPLGTMAFYESLQKVPGISVRRDHSSASQLPDGKNTSYLHLAARTSDWDWLPQDLWKEINGFLLKGGRLTITFFPQTGWNFWTPGAFITTTNTAGTNAPGFKGRKAQRKADLRKKLRGDDSELPGASLEEHWGVSFGHADLAQGDNDIYQPATVLNVSRLALPRALDWHSATVFTNLDKSWKTIYVRGKNPVVIERSFGAGTVVMATDSYFLSNEALRKDRHADLLAWLVGRSQLVIFDEAHFGIVDTSGVATLIRKYRLHGLAAGLLILAVLFIWKNSVSLVPLHADATPQNYVVGKDATSGFVNLLRRNISSRDILNVCFAEWTKTMMQGRHYTLAGVDQAQAVMETETARSKGDPVKAYQKICESLNRRASSLPPTHERLSD